MQLTLTSTKKSLLKSAILSISIAVLSLASGFASASTAPSVTGTAYIKHNSEHGDYVQFINSNGQTATPNFFPQISPVDGTGWEPAANFDAPYAYKCMLDSKNTCDVVVDMGKTFSNSLRPDVGLRNESVTASCSIRNILEGNCWITGIDHNLPAPLTPIASDAVAKQASDLSSCQIWIDAKKEYDAAQASGDFGRIVGATRNLAVAEVQCGMHPE